MAKALAAKGNPEIHELEDIARDEGEARGEARGKAESILKRLELHGVPVSEAQRQQVLGYRGLERLDRWLGRALLAASADEVTSES